MWMLWWAVGCASPEPGTPVPLAEVCTSDKMVFDNVENRGPRVTVEGYIAHPTMWMSCDARCSMSLAATPDGPPVMMFDVMIDIFGKNRMESIPDPFTEADIRIHTNEGEVVGVGSKVRVTGTHLGNDPKRPAGALCGLNHVDLVEAVRP